MGISRLQKQRRAAAEKCRAARQHKRQSEGTALKQGSSSDGGGAPSGSSEAALEQPSSASRSGSCSDLARVPGTGAQMSASTTEGDALAPSAASGSGSGLARVPGLSRERLTETDTTVVEKRKFAQEPHLEAEARETKLTKPSESPEGVQAMQGAGTPGTPTAASANVTFSDRKDRSIRLWGERGQLALEQGHVLVLNSSIVATEVLKNLVLPGVGKFTIVDNKMVTEQDLGNNFFVDIDCIGQLRAKHVTRLLLEMNEEVVGDYIDEDPVALIDRVTVPSYFANYSAVIATEVPEASLLKLAMLCWDQGTPLFIGRVYGMIGYWRNVLPEVCVIESRPEYAKENFRLHQPFPELQAFADQYDLEAVRHPHIRNTEVQQGPRRWVDSQGIECVPKAHSHIPCFVVLIKAMEAWKTGHGGLPPKTAAEKDEFKKMLDAWQLAPCLDEDNFVEAREQARHVLAPFEVPSEVRSLLNDDKASRDSTCDDPFWIITRALKMFVEGEGRGYLPLSGSLPDMHADTKSYVELQTIYKNMAEQDSTVVLKHVQDILKRLGKAPDHVKPDLVALACKNASNLRLVRTRSLEEEYSKPKPEEWSWMLDNREEHPHHLYILLRAADRFQTHFGAFPGAHDAGVAELAKFKEVVSTLCSEMAISPSNVGEDYMQEMVRYGGAQLHTMAAIIGGLGAQEVTKVLMKQFIPMNGTFLYNGISGKNGVCQF